MAILEQRPVYSRRVTSRVKTPDGVWVYWRCNGRADVSRVRDLSLRGLFLETQDPRPLGLTVKIDFLVQDGQIRAEAVVRHAKPTCGLGLQFTAVSGADCPNLTALMTRARHLPRSAKNVQQEELAGSNHSEAGKSVASELPYCIETSATEVPESEHLA